MLQGFVVGPKRERVAEFLSGGGVDEFELAVLGVVIEFFEDPGFDLRATVGEGDFVKVVLDDGFGFGGSLLGDQSDGWKRRWDECGAATGARQAVWLPAAFVRIYFALARPAAARTS